MWSTRIVVVMVLGMVGSAAADETALMPKAAVPLPDDAAPKITIVPLTSKQRLGNLLSKEADKPRRISARKPLDGNFRFGHQLLFLNAWDDWITFPVRVSPREAPAVIEFFAEPNRRYLFDCAVDPLSPDREVWLYSPRKPDTEVYTARNTQAKRVGPGHITYVPPVTTTRQTHEIFLAAGTRFRVHYCELTSAPAGTRP